MDRMGAGESNMTPLEAIQVLRDALSALVDAQNPCETDSSPAWCCIHQSKRCEMDKLVDAAKSALEETRTLQSTECST